MGIGGWTFPPWRGVFYPKGLVQRRELAYAAERLTMIEINGTYHSLQTPEAFARWAAETPPGFVFSVKASRFCTNRRELAGAGEAIERFFAQGLSELGAKLGPILWQFMPTKKFDAEDFGAFLKLLPKERDGLRLRHALEVRNESFRDPRFFDLARRAGAAVVLACSDKHPLFYDAGSDFAYLRLQHMREEEPQGLSSSDLDLWAERLGDLASGRDPRGMTSEAKTGGAAPRDVYALMINGAKVRAPAAAEALIERLSRTTVQTSSGSTS